jgi:ATP-binding cassette subfamily C protein
MLKIFRLFLRAEGTRPYIVLLALLLATLSEAVGISAMLSAISIISGGPGSYSSASRGVEAVLSSLGLQPTLETILPLICLAMVIKAVISFVTLTYVGVAAAKVSIGLRQRLINALFNADWRFYSSQASGKYATAISGEANRAGDAYLLAAQFYAMLIQAVIYVGVTMLVDWRLALLGLAAGLVMTGGMNFLVVMSKRAGFKQTDATKDLTVKAVELLANIKPLKTMQRYESFQSAIRQAMKRLKRALVRRELSKQLMAQIGDVVSALALVTVVYVSFRYFNVTLGSLVVSGLLFMKVIDNVGKLQKLRQQFAQSEGAYDRVKQLIELTEANHEPSFGTAKPDTTGDLCFEQVSFTYGSAPVLHDVNLTIGSKEITVLKGLSGSGKTTLVDILIGLHRPQLGRVLLGGVPLTEVDVSALRRRIGYVTQDLSLLHATIRENICLGDETLTETDVAAAIRLAGLEDFVADLPQGLETSAGEMGARLSGGQRQRIALARALVTRPDILILDEVTSALDPATEAEIVRNIRGLAHKFTIIVITHRDAWVDVADRLYEVRVGRVQAIATSNGLGR